METISTVFTSLVLMVADRHYTPVELKWGLISLSQATKNRGGYTYPVLGRNVTL